MKLWLLFVLPLIIVLAGVAYIGAPLVDSSLIANTIQEPLLEKLATGQKWRMQ